tara:strand:- start:71 stop:790 length:720 start_codon:yes stop_codon:yes gene_type:complete
MGIVEKILSRKKIEEESVISTDSLSVELSENFHIHYRNSRYELDHKEWNELSKKIFISYLKWLILFKPKSGDIDHSGKQIFLGNSKKIGGNPGEFNDYVRSDEIRIELQKWADYVHLHYKWLRLEFSINEFLDFADTVGDAKKELLKNFKINELPKREGKYHYPCPRGRVNKKDNIFWSESGQDSYLDDKHKSIYLDKIDESLMNKEKLLPKNNSFSNLICKFLLRFPIIGKIIGIKLK